MFPTSTSSFMFNVSASAGEVTYLDAGDSFLQFVTNTNISGVELTVNMYPEIEGTALYVVDSLGKYLRVESSGLEGKISWVLLKLSYTDEELDDAGLKEKNLRFNWFNESSGEWIPLDEGMSWVYGTGVDKKNNLVWANVSHLSSYALSGEPVKETKDKDKTTSSGGSSSGGGSSGGSISISAESCFDGIMNQGGWVWTAADPAVPVRQPHPPRQPPQLQPCPRHQKISIKQHPQH